MKTTGCLMLILLSSSAYAEGIPVESFGHLAIIENPSISPGGNHVVAVLNANDGAVVVVSEFGSKDLHAVLKLKKAEDRIEWVRWANDDRILISASYSQNFRGERVRVRRLFSIDRTGKGLEEIKRKTARKPLDRDRWWDTDTVLSILPDEPDFILMQLYDDQDDAVAVFKVDVTTNRFDKQFVNNYKVDRWYADTHGNVTFGVGWEKGIQTTWYRRQGSKDFEKINTRTMFEDEVFSPIIIDGQKAIVLSDHELGRDAIWRYDIPSGAFEELIYAVDGYDVSGGLLNTDETELIGAAHLEHYHRQHYFSEANADVYKLVKASFPEYQAHIVSQDSNWQKLIVLVIRDDSPAKYYWLDLSGKRGGLWFSEYPDLEKATLAKVRPFDFTARDGMKLNGYLTLPSNGKGEMPPLIVFPHGGPQSRDAQYFDPFVQYFASRGYAVLQVNFRGSIGFNNEYTRAGYREWGRAMQEDVYDAIDWLGEQNRVDMSRTCVIGASYGGFVALTAAYQRPKQFKCIVSISGVSDLIAMIETSLLYEETVGISYKETVGDIWDSEQKQGLRDNSPINHVEKIRAPILLVHGTYDTQVRVKQSVDFNRKAALAGLDIEYIEVAGGTHYFDENSNRLILFQALERFLAKHL